MYVSRYRIGEQAALVDAIAIPIKLDGKSEPICWVIKRDGESEDMFMERARDMILLLAN